MTMNTNLYNLKKYARNPSLDAPVAPLNVTNNPHWNCRGYSYLQNFQSVLFGKVYRSAAPNYSGDQIQKLSEAQFNFLDSQGFKQILSVNEYPMQNWMLLLKRHIKYSWLPVHDFHAMPLARLREAVNLINSGGKTLVYCGFGQGRTGTVIAAWAATYLLGHDHEYFKDFTWAELSTFLNSNFGVETPKQKFVVGQFIKEQCNKYFSAALPTPNTQPTTTANPFGQPVTMNPPSQTNAPAFANFNMQSNSFPPPVSGQSFTPGGSMPNFSGFQLDNSMTNLNQLVLSDENLFSSFQPPYDNGIF